MAYIGVLLKKKGAVMENLVQTDDGRWSTEYADAIGRVAVSSDSREAGERCLAAIMAVHGQYREPALLAVSTVAVDKEGFLCHSLVVSDDVDSADDLARKRWPESEGYTRHSGVVLKISPYVMLMSMAQSGNLLGSMQIMLGTER